jgi:hypothetical protein
VRASACQQQSSPSGRRKARSLCARSGADVFMKSRGLGPVGGGGGDGGGGSGGGGSGSGGRSGAEGWVDGLGRRGRGVWGVCVVRRDGAKRREERRPGGLTHLLLFSRASHTFAYFWSSQGPSVRTVWLALRSSDEPRKQVAPPSPSAPSPTSGNQQLLRGSPPPTSSAFRLRESRTDSHAHATLPRTPHSGSSCLSI